MNLLCDENFSYAKLSNVNEIYKIEKECFHTPWMKQQFVSEIKTDNSYTLLLKNEKEIVGFAIFWVIIDEIHILDLAVRKKYRRQGIGRGIINRIEETWKDKCRIMWLEVRQTNEISLSLYNSMGFKHILTRKRYYTDTNEDALILVKHIGVQ